MRGCHQIILKQTVNGWGELNILRRTNPLIPSRLHSYSFVAFVVSVYFSMRLVLKPDIRVIKLKPQERKENPSSILSGQMRGVYWQEMSGLLSFLQSLNCGPDTGLHSLKGFRESANFS